LVASQAEFWAEPSLQGLVEQGLVEQGLVEQGPKMA